MKKLFFALLIVCSSVSFAQDIKISSAGVEPYVVQVDSANANQLYNAVKLYIAKKFKNPDHVTKADEPGKLLRFEGYSMFKGGMMTEGKYTFTCEIEFKEGRYRISFFNLRRASGTQVLSDCFDKEGNIRKMNFYKTLHENFSTLVNAEHLEIKNSILEATSKKSDW